MRARSWLLAMSAVSISSADSPRFPSITGSNTWKPKKIPKPKPRKPNTPIPIQPNPWSRRGTKKKEKEKKGSPSRNGSPGESGAPTRAPSCGGGGRGGPPAPAATRGGPPGTRPGASRASPARPSCGDWRRQAGKWGKFWWWEAGGRGGKWRGGGGGGDGAAARGAVAVYGWCGTGRVWVWACGVVEWAWLPFGLSVMGQNLKCCIRMCPAQIWC